MKSFVSTLFLTFCLFSSQAQFSGAPNSGSSTAIHKDSSVIHSWATQCTVQRGKQNISNPTSPLVSYGADTDATGIANGQVVSLGDSGIAILTFDSPIVNGTGADFVVFENSFSDDFLELAFVEVSSDGVNYFRFPSTSYLPYDTQTGTFGTSDPTKINNLAGKFRVEYGVPFDLEELNDHSLLDKNEITHVKIIDVIGDISGNHTSYDQFNVPINDPFPTEFESGGFDLDAVGVIHSQLLQQSTIENLISVYPNPVKQGDFIHVQGIHFEEIELINIFNQTVSKSKTTFISTDKLSRGIYFLRIKTGEQSFTRKIKVI